MREQEVDSLPAPRGECPLDIRSDGPKEKGPFSGVERGLHTSRKDALGHVDISTRRIVCAVDENPSLARDPLSLILHTGIIGRKYREGGPFKIARRKGALDPPSLPVRKSGGKMWRHNHHIRSPCGKARRLPPRNGASSYDKHTLALPVDPYRRKTHLLLLIPRVVGALRSGMLPRQRAFKKTPCGRGVD